LPYRTADVRLRVLFQPQEESVNDLLFAVQKRLLELGFDPGPLDGIWGDQTCKAIAAQLGIKRALKPASDAVEAPWMAMARAAIGKKEVPGPMSNPDILRYYADAGVPQDSDEVPWCSAFCGAMLKEAGYQPSGSLMARSYLSWGQKLDKPRKGCVVVLKRGAAPSGHVAFAETWTGATIRLLGGNQGNSVSIASFSRAAVLGYRWPDKALAA
jgi:uncharacterized protein (TIGR02594 family)